MKELLTLIQLLISVISLTKGLKKYWPGFKNFIKDQIDRMYKPVSIRFGDLIISFPPVFVIKGLSLGYLYVAELTFVAFCCILFADDVLNHGYSLTNGLLKAVMIYVLLDFPIRLFIKMIKEPKRPAMG